MSGVWYRAALTNDQIGGGVVGIIQRLFSYATKTAIDGQGICLFATSHDTRVVRLREDAEDDTMMDADAVFFSPASVRLIPPDRVLRGAAEPSPDRCRAALLVGSLADWDLLPWIDH